ncbi:hypothetical protein HGRIS_014614 [Hohenbuehelia grisea]|uniref:protein-histidine N-methyltransferase n=1 Tax=Hohenbuehelia grisea TaxID=104357 RepID=A0ABR3JU03_9AGAR
MFKFDFDLEDIDESLDVVDVHPGRSSQASPLDSKQKVDALQFRQLSVEDLLDALPPLVSYSPLTIPLSTNGSLKSLDLVRRDLFDARFQLISEGKEQTNDEDTSKSQVHAATSDSIADKSISSHDETSEALRFLDAPSDLVPGVYEGGLKTWECALDLADYLDSQRAVSSDLHAEGSLSSPWSRVLEIGCGTGIPSIYLLHRIFSAAPPSSIDVDQPADSPDYKFHIHLQDFNASVLELMTLPNILLNWYISPASKAYREALPADEDGAATDASASPNPTLPGELHITPELKTAFLASLRSLGISIRLFAGAWESFDLDQIWAPSSSQPNGSGMSPSYDLVLTSETIYRMDSLPSLISLLRRASGAEPSPATAKAIDNAGTLANLVDAQLRVDNHGDTGSAGSTRLSAPDHVCLVAAKVLYFGVGGGVAEFVRAVEGGADRDIGQGSVSTVWEKNGGVGRCIMRVSWR